ncbi:MAG: FtsH protease modulator HflK [Pseudomonadota bacterium]
MAWNQPGGGKEPWKPKGGGNPVDDFLGRLKSQLGIGDAGNGPSWVKPVLIALAVLIVFNCFQLIDERERGVVLRFGKFDRIMTPGANMKLPWPIESVTVVNATQVQTVEETVNVLTKDENIVDIKFNAQYTISDPRLYLYGYRDDIVAAGGQQGSETVRQAAESAVREVVGNNTMDATLQKSLDMYRTGIKVSQFTLPDARFPEEVSDAFNEAINAGQQSDSIKNAALAYASKIVPEARGAASRIKAEADGYRQASIAKATGDASRFRQLADEYRKSPEVTRKRLYLETMQDVMTRNPKIVSGRGNIFYLPAPGSAASAPSADGVSRPSPAVVTPPVPPADSTGRGEARQGREGT